VGLEPRLAAELAADFEPDIRCVENFLGRNLSEWRAPASPAMESPARNARRFRPGALPRLVRRES
jgi:hypothetical protein